MTTVRCSRCIHHPKMSRVPHYDARKCRFGHIVSGPEMATAQREGRKPVSQRARPWRRAEAKRLAGMA